MARWMLSLGMLPSLALETARASAGFISGSPPPSRAATVMALDSLPNSAPRLASAAPFLRLIVDHLLWPLNVAYLPQKILVKSRVVGELGVERRNQYVLTARGDDLVVYFGEDLDARADVLEERRPDKDPRERLVEAIHVEVLLKGVDLPPKPFALAGRVHQAEERLARPVVAEAASTIPAHVPHTG